MAGHIHPLHLLTLPPFFKGRSLLSAFSCNQSEEWLQYSFVIGILWSSTMIAPGMSKARLFHLDPGETLCKKWNAPAATSMTRPKATMTTRSILAPPLPICPITGSARNAGRKRNSFTRLINSCQALPLPLNSAPLLESGSGRRTFPGNPFSMPHRPRRLPSSNTFFLAIPCYYALRFSGLYP